MTKSGSRFFWSLAATAVLIFVLSVSISYSQIVTATVVGTVKDPTGAVVPKAQVVATDVATGISHSAIANSSGHYRIGQLQPGTYKLSARYPGFKESILTGIILQVDLTSRVNITLSPGAVHQSVTVASHAPVINTESPMVGQVISTRKILEMPLNGRNFMELATLTPGINGGNGSTAKGGILNKGYAPAAAGMDATENNYELDGVDNRDPFFHTFNYAPPIDSIQEFNIQVGQYSAQFGNGGGAVINVVTKSGTNRFHGSAYEFLRNTALDSRNFFARGIPPLHRNQFGVSLGGPIKKNKAFFFGNYEGFRETEGLTRTADVPTAAEKQGNLSALGGVINDPATGQPFTGNIIPSGLISPISTALLKYYPSPNVPQTGTFNFVSSPVYQDNYNNYLGRFDYNLSEKNSIMARYGDETVSLYTPGTYPLVGGQAQPQDFQNAAIGLTTDISPTLVNVARFGYDRTVNETTGQNTGNPIAAKAGMLFGASGSFYSGFPEGIGLSSTLISGIGEGQPWFLHTNSYQWYDGLTWMHHNQTIETGFSISHSHIKQQYATHSNGDYTFSGQYTGNGFGDFLLGNPSHILVATAPNALQRYTFSHWSAYVADDWRATPKLTLNIGLRYGYHSPPHEEDGLTPVFDPTLGGGTGGLLFPAQNANIGKPYSAKYFFPTFRPDLPFGFLNRNTAWIPVRDNFAPRFGFAYRLFGSGQTVLRGGYGWYYLEPQLTNVVQNASVAPPATQWPTFVGNIGVPNLTWNGQAGVNPNSIFDGLTFGLLTGPQQKILNAYTQQWSLGVEHELGANTGITVEYLGSKTTHLIQSWGNNATTPSAAPLTPRLPYPKWGRIFGFASGANANYNSLLASADKRFGHGISFIASYTYAKALASQGADFAAGDIGEVQNPFNRNAMYGPTIDDVTHRFTISYLYQLPFGHGKPFGNGLTGFAGKLASGWTFAGITTAETGFPITPTVPASSNCNDSVFPNLCFPDLIGNPNLGGNGVNSPKYNVSAFTWPTKEGLSPRYGNAGVGILRSNGSQIWDFSLIKNTKIAERYTLEFRSEFFNGFNHPNFGAPNASPVSPSFGRTTSAGSPREIQFALKLYW